MTRVVVAMSGGVDSSVAAALLVEQGYEVIGIMLRLWGEGGDAHASTNRCCTLEDMELAYRVADHLGIPFYVLNVADFFKQTVVDFFIREYLAGRTPNPCLRCNRFVRFDWLLRRALALGAEYLATGHYARVREVDGRYQLLRGADPRKDQSYVLAVLGQRELRHAMFPVGGYTKEEVRALARRFGLPVADKPESQDLCFIADGDYRAFLRRHAPEALRPGPIKDTGGRILGQHQGLAFYTIGQRRGLGIAAGVPLYVVDIDPVENAVIVGTAEELGRRACLLEGVHFISGEIPPGPFRATVKIRYRAREVPAWIIPLPEGRARVVFDEPMRDLTPGQAAVMYDGEVVLGLGLIARLERDPAGAESRWGALEVDSKTDEAVISCGQPMRGGGWP